MSEPWALWIQFEIFADPPQRHNGHRVGVKEALGDALHVSGGDLFDVLFNGQRIIFRRLECLDLAQVVFDRARGMLFRQGRFRGRNLFGGNGGSGERRETLGRLTRKDRKSTRLNSSHITISYAVFCLKKKK